MASKCMLDFFESFFHLLFTILLCWFEEFTLLCAVLLLKCIEQNQKHNIFLIL